MNAVTDKAAKSLSKARKKAEAALEEGRHKADEALKSARARGDEAVKAARAKGDEAVKAARARADEAAKLARAKTDEAIKVARARAAEAAESTRASARKAADKTGESIEANPIAALIGGLAIGAIAGALIPRSKQEEKAFGKAGRTIRETANSAVRAARDAGKDQLDALGVNADAAKDQMRDIARKLGEAASSAGAAAADTVRSKK